jgi:hypothetical protein
MIELLQSTYYQECANNCDCVFDDGGRVIVAKPRGKLRAKAAPAERTYDRPYNACNQPSNPTPATGPDRRARQSSHHETRPELYWHFAAWRGGELIHDELDQGEQR